MSTSSCFRLPTDVRPREYRLRLDLDLESGRFEGEVAIAVELDTPRRSIALHARGLAVEAASARGAVGSVPARVEPLAGEEVLELCFPEPLPAGEATLHLRWSGALQRELRGLYGVEVASRRYALTQCQPADARRILPCFDEPAFKASWRIEVSAPAGLVAISNAPVESSSETGGRCLTRFAATPPLASYLVALAVGSFDASEPDGASSPPLRVWHLPGKAGLTDFALEVAREVLPRLERYFGHPYPYAKLDLVGVPELEAGAMENAGAVFFRETALLVDPVRASLEDRKRIAMVITHELAHMWFGNLVTLRWWDDLWLNEAFANWLAYRVVDAWRPEWGLWRDFELERNSALGADALTATHAVAAPVASVAEALENFDAITYQKGAAVVRMLEHFLGPETFRAGVRRYVARHAGVNASAGDLWRALAEAAGRDVAAVAERWVRGPGHPLLHVERDDDAAGIRLRLRQERFFTDARTPDDARRALWPVPVVTRGLTPARAFESRFLLEGAQATLPIEGDGPLTCACANADGGGFYRTRYDEPLRTALLEHLHDFLTPVERIAFVWDQWELVRACQARIAPLLELIEALADERDPLVLRAVASVASVVQTQLTSPDGRERKALQGWLARSFGPAFDKLGWDSDPAEDGDTRQRRAALLRLLGELAEAPGVVAEASRRVALELSGGAALAPDLLDTAVALAARVGTEADYECCWLAMRSAATPQARRRHLLALGSFRTQSAVARSLEAALSAEVPMQDVGFLLVRLLQNPAAADTTWRFYAARWQELRSRMGAILLSRFVEATPALRAEAYALEIERHFQRHPAPEVQRSVEQALELFALHQALRSHCQVELEGWLHAR